MSIEKNTGKCRSCGAAVVWVITPAGKKMPVDAKPVSGFVLDENENGTVNAFSGKVYVSHFATCPDSEAWRKP